MIGRQTVKSGNNGLMGHEPNNKEVMRVKDEFKSTFSITFLTFLLRWIEQISACHDSNTALSLI